MLVKPADNQEEDDACFPTRRVVKKMASLLVKPKVTFVSLVGHAANGLPFSMIKSEDGKLTEIQPHIPMPKTTIPSFGSAGATLSRLEFDLNLFKTESDVRAYLKDSDILATRITKTETHFVVNSVHEDSLDEVQAVKGDKDGVTYFIGKLKANISAITPKSPAAPTSTLPVKKGDEPKARLRGDDGEPEGENEFELVFKSEAAPEMREVVTKMDSYIARHLKTQTVDETLSTGDSEIPGLHEIMAAVRVTVQNIVSNGAPSDYSAKISAAFSRGGQIAAALANIFVTVKKSETEGEADVVTVNRELARKHFSSPEVVAAPAVAAEGVVTKSEIDTPVTETASPDAALAGFEELLKKHIAPLNAKVETIEGSVEAVSKSVTETVTKLESRVVGLEVVRQNRQSLPDDGEPTPVVKSEEDKQEEVRKAEKLKRDEEEKRLDDEFARKQARSRMGVVN